MSKKKLREDAETRFALMANDRAKYEPWWKELGKQFAQSRGRFHGEERAKQSPKRRNSRPYQIADAHAAGMQSGLMSPTRQWFTLNVFDRDLETIERVRAYLNEVQEIMQGRLLQSNFYDQAFDFLKEEGVYGTAAMFIEEDDEDVFVCKTLTAGQYSIGTDDRGRVNRFARSLSYTVLQLVEDFGYEHLPREIQAIVDRNESNNARFEVRHLIQPNTRYESPDPGPPGMAYQSLWWLPGYSDPLFVRESGYHEFPVIVARWRIIGNDIYGREQPADVALDDAQTLQDLETDARGALEREVKPPMLAPSSLAGKLDNRPNKVSLYEPIPTQGGVPAVTPLFNVKFSHEAAETKIAMLVQAIESAFFVDLFRMWSSDLRIGRTATEIQARDAERAYILGPVTLRQTNEFATKVLIRLFGILQRAPSEPGNPMLPVPPPELAEKRVKIEYTSEFALLQKQAARGGIEAVLAMAAQLAELQAATGGTPDVLDKIDPDEILDQVADMYAIPAGMVLGDDATERLREDRALAFKQQQEAAMAQEQMARAAQSAPDIARAAKDLSEAKMGGRGGNNALEFLTNALDEGGGTM